MVNVTERKDSGDRQSESCRVMGETLDQLEGRVLGDDLIINLYWGFLLRGLARQGMTP